MKILLLSANTAKTPYPVYPLGMSIIAKSLIQAGQIVRQTDFLYLGQSYDLLISEIKDFKPDVIGISIRNIDNTNSIHELEFLKSVKSIVNIIKAENNLTVVLGGAGFSLMPEKILEYTKADYGINGEGEKSFLTLISKFQNNEFPDKKIFQSNQMISGEKIMSAEYDSRLMNFYSSFGKIGSMQTKRGCLYKCSYCTYPLLEGPDLRLRNPGDVCDDIELLIDKHGIRFLFFTDSLFNDPKQQYLAIINEMKLRKICVPWSAFFSPEGLNEQNLNLMKETGLTALELGSDATTDITLKALKKSFSFHDIQSCNDLLADLRLPAAHYFIFGGPEETIETAMEGIQNIKNLKDTVSFIFSGIRILPGTQLFDRAIQEHVISSDTDLLKPFYYLSPKISKQSLHELLKKEFSNSKQWIFPPDAMEDNLCLFHKMGCNGIGWDQLVKNLKKRKHKQTS